MATATRGRSHDLPQSAHPNYTTPRGLARLKERLAEAQEKRHALLAGPDGLERDLPLANVAREIRYLEARIERAIPIDPAANPRTRSRSGRRSALPIPAAVSGNLPSSAKTRPMPSTAA